MSRGGTFRIGRIHGIDIRVHFTFLLVLPLFAFYFAHAFAAAARMANVSASSLRGSPWLWGAGLAVALFGSVVLHELAHALYAMRTGGRVRSITLLLIGGVSEMIQMPPRPRDEAVMALLGPVVSLAIGGACYLLHLVIPHTAFSWRFGLFYLGALSIVLGLFNLLPAYPLDGGRILRSVLTHRMGQVRATQVAARVGKVIAVLMGIWGFFTLNMLLVLVAIFVFMGADSENRAVVIRTLLGHLLVRDVMTAPPAAIRAETSLEEAVERMLREKQLCLAVLDGAQPIGIVTLEAVRAVPTNSRRLQSARTTAIATPSLAPSDAATKALSLLGQSSVPELLVTEGEQLVGSVSRDGIARYLSLHELKAAGPARRMRWEQRNQPT